MKLRAACGCIMSWLSPDNRDHAKLTQSFLKTLFSLDSLVAKNTSIMELAKLAMVELAKGRPPAGPNQSEEQAVNKEFMAFISFVNRAARVSTAILHGLRECGAKRIEHFVISQKVTKLKSLYNGPWATSILPAVPEVERLQNISTMVLKNHKNHVKIESTANALLDEVKALYPVARILGATALTALSDAEAADRDARSYIVFCKVIAVTVLKKNSIGKKGVSLESVKETGESLKPLVEKFRDQLDGRLLHEFHALMSMELPIQGAPAPGEPEAAEPASGGAGPANGLQAAQLVAAAAPQPRSVSWGVNYAPY